MYQDTKDDRIKLLGETYHARFSCKGRRVQESLHTKNFKVAVKLVDDIETAILLGEDWKQDKHLFEDLWPQFLDAKIKGKQRGRKVRQIGKKTLAYYIHFGERYYLPFFGEMRVDKIDGEAWERYMDFAKSKSKSGQKTKMLNHWKYLSGFMSWCKAMDYIRRMPDIYNTDEAGDDDDTPGRNLSDDELGVLRAYAKMPMKLWIYMGQYMGMRSFEISQLLKSRIDTNEWMINLGRAAKGGRPRKVPIHPDVRDLLLEQIVMHENSPYLFPNAIDSKRPMDVGGFKKPWTKLRNDTNIRCVFKDFRSSCASRMGMDPGLNPALACQSLGMSLKVFMKHYYKPTEEQLHRVTEAIRL